MEALDVLLAVAAEDLEGQAVVGTERGRIDRDQFLQVAAVERELEREVLRTDQVRQLGVVAVIAKEGRIERV